MEIKFSQARSINVTKCKALTGATWLQLTITDNDGEHTINCFPEGETIPITLNPNGDDDE